MRYLSLILLLLVGSVAMATPTALTVLSSTETPALLAGATGDSQNGNSVANLGENVVLYLKNTSGGSTGTVTITAQAATFTIPGVGPVTKSNISQLMATGSEYVIGPFPAQAYNDANGNIQVTYSGGASNVITIKPITSVKLMKIP